MVEGESPRVRERALVLGASGYIGSHLVPRLREAGYEVRAASRNPDVLASRGWRDVEIVAADAFDAASLDRALEGVSVAYYLVHSMAAGRDFAERDRVAAATFRDAARRAGVRRVIYLGGLQPPGDSSEHLASRRETGEVLRAGGPPVTEVRAGIIVGPGSAAFEVIRDLVYHLPVMITPRWVRSRTQPIALGDLVEYLVRLPAIPESAGQVFDVGGPDVLRYEQMLRQAAETLGRRIRVIPAPVLTPRLSSYWLDLVTAVPANVVRPLIDGLTHDLLADDRAIRALIPIPLHTYREAVRDALRIERESSVPSRWTEGAMAFRAERPEVSFFSRRERHEAAAGVPADRLWAEVATIGGDTGWRYLDWLWRVRGLLDRIIGGVGMRRGRRHPSDLRVGDAIDFWRVAAIEPGARLTLVAEMRLPGAAVLEFEVEPLGERASRLVTSAYFHPAGLPGLLYWYALLPIHPRIFRGMTLALARAAERGAGRGAEPALDPTGTRSERR